MTIILCNKGECSNNTSGKCRKKFLSIYRDDENEYPICDDANNDRLKNGDLKK